MREMIRLKSLGLVSGECCDKNGGNVDAKIKCQLTFTYEYVGENKNLHLEYGAQNFNYTYLVKHFERTACFE